MGPKEKKGIVVFREEDERASKLRTHSSGETVERM